MCFVVLDILIFFGTELNVEIEGGNFYSRRDKFIRIVPCELDLCSAVRVNYSVTFTTNSLKANFQ